MLHFRTIGSRWRKLTTSFLVPVAATVYLVAPGSVPAQAAAPNCKIFNYYGQGASGTSNYGTADQIRTWSSWNVPNEAGGDFSDEAVWSLDYNQQHNALEVGFFTGAGNGNLIGGSNQTNGMIPYFTLNNGDDEADFWGDFLPRNTLINMIAQATGTTFYAYVDGRFLNAGMNYIVNEPRWGFTQGEVAETDATMRGGSDGDESTVYWIDSSGALHDWGFINTCADSPYWSGSTNGTDDFENGGPG